MKLSYQELPSYQFPHWIEFKTTPGEDDFNLIMDINEWAGVQYGDLGTSWGYERQIIILPHASDINPVHIRRFFTEIVYSWRFKDKSDVMAFKLAWGGV